MPGTLFTFDLEGLGTDGLNYQPGEVDEFSVTEDAITLVLDEVPIPVTQDPARTYVRRFHSFDESMRGVALFNNDERAWDLAVGEDNFESMGGADDNGTTFFQVIDTSRPATAFLTDSDGNSVRVRFAPDGSLTVDAVEPTQAPG